MSEFSNLAPDPNFEDASPSEPSPPRRGATTESIALIANNNGNGVVLASHGQGIGYFIEACGPYVNDMGLDDAPEGITIWEGRIRSVHCPEGDHDEEPVGTFRPLTPDEWALLAATGVPWELKGDGPAPRLPSRRFIPTDEQRHNDPLLRSLADMGATEVQVIEALRAKTANLEREALRGLQEAQPVAMRFYETPSTFVHVVPSASGVSLEPCTGRGEGDS